MSQAIVHARVLGPKQHRTPTGEPALLSTPAFNDAQSDPIDEIAKAAQKRHGHVAHAANWRIISIYDVRESALVRSSKGALRPAAYETVYIAEYIPERAMRKQLGIDDAKTLDPFKESWYLAARTT